MSLARPTVYGQIAADLRRAILGGQYESALDDPRGGELPSATELSVRFGVSPKTAARAVQQLVTEGLAEARSGMRATVVPRVQRTARWPMTGRYARARDASGLVFGADMQGRQVEKRVIRTGWVAVPPSLTASLAVDSDQQVWSRVRRMLIDGEPAELSVSYFPAHVTELAPELISGGSYPAGGVVGVLEHAGFPILRTANEVRARLATDDELDALGPDAALQPLSGLIVLEVSHITYGADAQPLEAVVSVRPATDNVVTFETAETPEHDAQRIQSGPP